MTFEKAQTEALAAAKQNGIDIAIVNAPIENAEDPTGPYGYCPMGAVDMLFANGTIHALAKPDGSVVIMAL